MGYLEGYSKYWERDHLAAIQGNNASTWSGCNKSFASNSRQGEKKFQNEVSLLRGLHHRNSVNLVGYCVDKGQYMLISNGSLEKDYTVSIGEGDTLTRDERLHSSAATKSPEEEHALDSLGK